MNDQINWDDFLALVKRHRIEPNIYQKIKNLCKNRIPLKVFHQIQELNYKCVIRNLKMTAKMVNLVHLLEAHHIPVIVFKGPVLAMQLYDNINARHYNDIDFIIPPEMLSTANNLMYQQGFQNLFFKNSPYIKNDQLPFFKKITHHFGYFHPDIQITFEIHWRFFRNPQFLKIDPFQDLTTVNIGGTRIPTISLTESIFFLFAHGASHSWFRLKWLCDINQLFSINPPLNWRNIINRSKNLSIDRMLFQGLLLTRDLFNQDLPEECAQNIKYYKTVTYLMVKALEKITGPEGDNNFNLKKWSDHAKYKLRLKKNIRYRLTFFSSLFRLIPKGLNKTKIPSKLLWIFFCFRPLTKICRKIIEWKKNEGIH
ncbi:MAG: nucleotidyltransferase family protein [Candidatus Aminicenantes bacterium]|nr:nucleotidyltransferase family protein [Candidatus Aminicenantes bacterium]